MKHKKLVKTLSIVLTSLGFVAASAIMATQAWFHISVTHTPSWQSSSEGAYFAYGDGTAESPYGINRPIHLYNLAWLQYLGFFDTNHVSDSYNLDNIYFELAADVDMTGWTLPPIGTVDHPFVGNFDGQGFKIKNLTVSNQIGDYNRIPFGVTRSDFPNKVNIVGLFGVVGQYESNSIASYDSSANEIINTGITGLTVVSKSTTTLAGLAAGYVNGTISGVAVNDSYIDLRNSGGQAISSITTNISDYSLIGHAADAKYLAKLQSSETTHYTPTISNPFYSQGGTEWGASIDMESMYTTLKNKMNNANFHSGSYEYYQEDTRTELTGGGYDPETGYNLGTPLTTNYTANGNYGNSSKGVYYYASSDLGTDTKNQSVQTASYNFINQYSKTSSATNFRNYTYVGLGGKTSLVDYTYTHRETTTTQQTYTHYYFRDSDTQLYLTTSGTSVSSASSDSYGWVFDNSNHLYTTATGTKKYLNVSGSNLVLSDTGTTTWTWDATASSLKTGNVYVGYDPSAGTWRTYNNLTQNISYYTYMNSNYYLRINGTTISSVNNSGNATHFYTVVVDGKTYPYCVNNGTTYYIHYANNAVSVTTSIDATTFYYRQTTGYNAGNYLSYVSGTTTYNLRIRNNGSVQRNTGNYTVTINTGTEQKTLSLTRTNDTKALTTYQETSEDRHVYANETYFPLTWADDKINPAEKNTGYVVSGTNYVDNDNPSIGDIRVASYYKTTTNLKNALTSGTSYYNNRLFAYTFDSGGNLVKIGDEVNGKKTGDSAYTSYETLGLKKYYYNLLGRAAGSRIGLGNMLGESGDNIAYGLHFMNADISMNNLITVPYAMINGDEYYDYELPRDSIDFILKKEGYINFFAATYYYNSGNWSNSNNSFFSLHIIDRHEDNDDCTIDHIKQIAKVYKNTAYDNDSSQPQYVYTYRDSNDNEVAGTWDTGVRDDNNNLIIGEQGALVFDTYWLTDPDYNNFKTNAVYYFEIPVNRGEFALGSTSGKTSTARHWASAYNKNGAYLLYLDIGASAKNVDGITVEDTSTTITKKYNYPVGIDFKAIDTSSTAAADYTDVLGGESSAIIVPSGNTQKINYSYTPKGDEKALLSVGPEGGGGTFTATYKTVGTEVKNKSGTALGIVEASSSTDVMEREILYDLRDMTSDAAISVTPTITVVHTIDNVRGEEVESTGTAIELSKAIVETMPTFEPDSPVILYVVDYSNTLSSDESNMVSIDSTYGLLDKTYNISFISSEEDKTTEIMFISMNLSQTYTINNQSVTYTYVLIVDNNVEETGSALGTITSSNINSDVIIICIQPS